jgi:peptidoglycan/xylan/chitin deacetylase (PgdA/CDA1 family)
VKIRGIGKLKRSAGRWGRRFARQSLVLMYHRIHEAASDPWSLCVSPRHFAEHLEVLGSLASSLRLSDLGKALCDDSLPDRGVAVTFDDGYADNLYIARPLLEKHAVPATVFVATGQVGSEREFWWDELERLLLQPGVLPEDLCLTVNGADYRWRLGRAAEYSEKDFLRNSQRRAWEGDQGSRLHLYHTIWGLLLPLSQQAQREVLDQLVDWASRDPSARSSHRSLTAEEICTLMRDGLIQVGAHTITHPFLSAHSAAFQREEIFQSKARLEEITGIPVTCFAYPYGNYTKITVVLSREADFDCACTAVDATIWRFTDPFLMPRLAVGNWDGDEFARQLTKYLGAFRSS